MSELRHYQLDAKSGVGREFETHRSTLVVMPTGTGKTQLFGSIVGDRADAGERSLVLAHRNELIIQARDRIEQMTGRFCDIEKAERRAYYSPIVVGSMQSVCQKRRLQRLGRDAFGLIVVDEAHRSLADSYMRILEWFDSAKILGVTATPDRGDGKALGRAFESEAYRLEIRRAIELGWLVDVEAERVYLDEIDVSHVHKTAGDLQVGELDEAMVKAAAAVAQKSTEIIGPEDGQGIAFFPGVASAALACEWFNKYRPGCAEFVCGETNDDERDRIFRDFKAGRFQFLVNVDIATEGFDHPPVRWCIMARLTASRGRYAQCAGRVTRPLWEALRGLPLDEGSAELRRVAIASSAKPTCKILDFNGNTGKHSLVGPEDVLGGDYTEAEVKEAKRAAEQSGEMGNVADRLSEARKNLQRIAKEHQARLRARREQVSPWAPSYGSQQESGPPPRDAATQRQKDFLRNLGVKFDPAITKRQAKKLLDAKLALYKDPTKRPASPKQMYRLRQYTSVREDLSFAAASKGMDYVSAMRVKGMTPDVSTLDRILGE